MVDKKISFTELIEAELTEWFKKQTNNLNDNIGGGGSSGSIGSDGGGGGSGGAYKLRRGSSLLVEDYALTESFDVFVCSAITGREESTDDDKLFHENEELIDATKILDAYMNGKLTVNWLNENIKLDSEEGGVMILDKIKNLVEREFKRQQAVMILIEGFEHVLNSNLNIWEVEKFVRYLRRVAVREGAIQLIAVNPEKVSEDKLKILEKAVDKVL